MTQPEISIRLMVYNHGKYLEDAFEGIFSQKVNVPYEVVVGNDFSNDNSASIITKYQKKYPDIVRVLEREGNQEYISKRKKGSHLVNFYDILKNCRGKYVAILDGDDFWCDESKLQKQYDFLEQNKNVSLCYTGVKILNDETNEITYYDFVNKSNYIQDFNSYLRNYEPTPSATMFFRNNLTYNNSFEKTFCSAFLGDYALRFFLGNIGDFGFLSENTAVYRKHDAGLSGVTAIKSIDIERRLNCNKTLYNHFKPEYKWFLKRPNPKLQEQYIYALLLEKKFLKALIKFPHTLYGDNYKPRKLKDLIVLVKSCLKIIIHNQT